MESPERVLFNYPPKLRWWCTSSHILMPTLPLWLLALGAMSKQLDIFSPELYMPYH